MKMPADLDSLRIPVGAEAQFLVVFERISFIDEGITLTGWNT
jgi:hypothetical protein